MGIYSMGQPGGESMKRALEQMRMEKMIDQRKVKKEQLKGDIELCIEVTNRFFDLLEEKAGKLLEFAEREKLDGIELFERMDNDLDKLFSAVLMVHDPEPKDVAGVLLAVHREVFPLDFGKFMAFNDDKFCFECLAIYLCAVDVDCPLRGFFLPAARIPGAEPKGIVGL